MWKNGSDSMEGMHEKKDRKNFNDVSWEGEDLLIERLVVNG